VFVTFPVGNFCRTRHMNEKLLAVMHVDNINDNETHYINLMRNFS